MNILLKSLFVLSLIPLLTMAIEPVNPISVCERFLSDTEQKACESKIKGDQVDWYAAAACASTHDDKVFWTCWNKIKGATFNPVALDKCSDEKSLTDEARLTCIEKSQLGRTPASKTDSEFQSLKIKH